jgi:hypothetical protein
MRTGIVCLTAVLALALVLHAGEGTVSEHEAIVKDMLATLGRVNKILEEITDEDTAAAARPDLKKAGLRLRDLRKKALQVKQPSKEEKERLEKQYRGKFAVVLDRLRVESRRVREIPGGADAVKEIAAEVEKKGKDAKAKKGDKDKK